MAVWSTFDQPVSTKDRVDEYVAEHADKGMSNETIEKLVLARLTDDWGEVTVYGPWAIWQVDYDTDGEKGSRTYTHLRHSATKRFYQQERALAVKYNSRAARANRGGRRSAGFYSYRAYAPKRSWMQGRPRK
jgi:hypothetical protein